MEGGEEEAEVGEARSEVESEDSRCSEEDFGSGWGGAAEAASPECTAAAAAAARLLAARRRSCSMRKEASSAAVLLGKGSASAILSKALLTPAKDPPPPGAPGTPPGPNPVAALASNARWCMRLILCLASSNRCRILSTLAACREGRGMSNSRLLRLLWRRGKEGGEGEDDIDVVVVDRGKEGATELMV